MPLVLDKSRRLLYADDEAAHCSGSTAPDNININTAKTKVVPFGTKETRYPDSVLNEEKLHVQNTYKYLGFTLGNKLTLKQQVNITQRNVSHKLYYIFF